LEVAGISKRVVTLLNKEGIKSLKDLKQKKESLQMIKGLGKKSLEEITKALGS